MRRDNHVFLENGSDLFLREGLETDDHVEGLRKMRFLAHAICPVIPGQPVRAEPGIHNHDCPWLGIIVSRCADNDGLWLWIPGSRSARPGMTTAPGTTRAGPAFSLVTSGDER